MRNGWRVFTGIFETVSVTLASPYDNDAGGGGKEIPWSFNLTKKDL